MRPCGSLLIALLLLAPAAHAQRPRKFPEPIHPDTLPTLIQSWFLPASLAPYVTNTYAPRMTLKGGVLFVFDHHGRRLVAVDAKSGKVKWSQPVQSASDLAFAFTPMVVRNRVYIADHGFVYGFNTQTGKKVMQLPTKGLAVNGFGRSKHRLFLPWVRVKGATAEPGVWIWAIDSRRGRVEWNKKFPGQIGYVVGNSDGPCYVSNTGQVLGLTPDRGEPRWQVRVKGEVLSPPILHHGLLYITTHRKKAGWDGTGIAVVDTSRGKILWQDKLGTRLHDKALLNGTLVTVDATGRVTHFDADGKKIMEVKLQFGDEPNSLRITTMGDRAFVFSSHSDGNGYVWLVDMKKGRLIAKANAVDAGVRDMISAGKMLFMDANDGMVHAFRLDRSRRPTRMSVPPGEFATELLTAVAGAKAPIRGLAAKLAGLGPKALPAIEPALGWENPYVVQVAADAIAFVHNRRSVPALIKAVKRLQDVTPAANQKVDPLIPVLEAIATLRDGKAVPVLQKLLGNATQDPMRRRAAYVALGAIGTPAALGPIWSYRAVNRVGTYQWDPPAYTRSYAYKVEQDQPPLGSPEEWSEQIRKETTLTIQPTEGHPYTVALSPYLGGYNDIWVGPSDLDGRITRPLFTGFTKPEVEPNMRLKLKAFTLDKDLNAKLTIAFKQDKTWVDARPVTFSLKDLAADYDGDKLPDVVERRLHLCVTNKDCDGDGLADNEDLNPLASSKLKLSREQQVFQEAFFTYYSFMNRRGVVVVDPGDGPSFELYGRKDPILSLRRPTAERFRKSVGLHATDFVTFGGPYPEGGGSGDALPRVRWNRKKTEATLGMDIFRSSENAAAYNVTVVKKGRKWVVTRMDRAWTTNE